MKALIITFIASIFTLVTPPPINQEPHPGVPLKAPRLMEPVAALEHKPLPELEKIPIGKEVYLAELKKYDWDADVAAAIIQAESKCKVDARGDGHLTYTEGTTRYGDSWGLFQVRYLPGRPTPDELKDYKTNIAHAYKLYKSRGTWTDWTMYNNGQYRNYLGGKACQ